MITIMITIILIIILYMIIQFIITIVAIFKFLISTENLVRYLKSLFLYINSLSWNFFFLKKFLYLVNYIQDHFNFIHFLHFIFLITTTIIIHQLCFNHFNHFLCLHFISFHPFFIYLHYFYLP